jgi:exonuclease V
MDRCEVQFEYGLLQKKFKKLEQRPASFVSQAGKVIHVDVQVAKTMDRVAKRGEVCIMFSSSM